MGRMVGAGVRGEVQHRLHPGSLRSQVCDTKRVICGAAAEPTLPEKLAVALHQRESSFSFFRSPGGGKGLGARGCSQPFMHGAGAREEVHTGDTLE